MSFFKNIIDKIEKLPEGIQRAEDTIIGTYSTLTVFLPSDLGNNSFFIRFFSATLVFFFRRG